MRAACSWRLPPQVPVVSTARPQRSRHLDDFLQESALVSGELAFRQHGGGHTNGPNWPTFLAFADRYFNGKPLLSSLFRDHCGPSTGSARSRLGMDQAGRQACRCRSPAALLKARSGCEWPLARDAAAAESRRASHADRANRHRRYGDVERHPDRRCVAVLRPVEHGAAGESHAELALGDRATGERFDPNAHAGTGGSPDPASKTSRA